MQYDFNNNWIGNASLLHSRILAHCSWREREKNRKENIKWGIFDCVRDLFIEVYACYKTRLLDLYFYVWTVYLNAMCLWAHTNKRRRTDRNVGLSLQRWRPHQPVKRWRRGNRKNSNSSNKLYVFFEFIFIIVNSRVKREFGSFVRLTWFETM